MHIVTTGLFSLKGWRIVLFHNRCWIMCQEHRKCRIFRDPKSDQLENNFNTFELETICAIRNRFNFRRWAFLEFVWFSISSTFISIHVIFRRIRTEQTNSPERTKDGYFQRIAPVTFSLTIKSFYFYRYGLQEVVKFIFGRGYHDVWNGSQKRFERTMCQHGKSH